MKAHKHKVIRPSVMNYSFYTSARNTVSGTSTVHPLPQPGVILHYMKLGLMAAMLATIFSVGVKLASNSLHKSLLLPTSGSPAVVTTISKCSANDLNHYVLVSIGARHMWACEGSKQVYDSSVVTGIEYLAADKTPVGTYKVYSKQTNQKLTGCDTTGCWNDPVHYWMPFLSNKYGIYGFHDATWRNPYAFGNISPSSKDASHGCVELPLATAKWLYGWAPVGTTVKIES